MKPFSSYLLTETAPSLVEGTQVFDVDWKKVVMRKVAWMIIFSYALMMIKPVIPVFADALAHTFWEKQHMLVHEEHGRFHVHYEVMKAYGQTDKGKSSTPVRSVTEDDLYTLSTNIGYSIINFYQVKRPEYALYRCSHVMSFPDMHYPPPKSVLL